MKFIAKKSISNKITEGKIYFGNLVWKFEAARNGSSATSELKIVVYNDAETWSAYSPSYFEPHEEY